jgi:hypothetical protein
MNDILNLEPAFSDADAVYQDIIDMHKGLSDEESKAANAKLVLLLVNHIGDPAIIAEATRLARENTLAWRKEGGPEQEESAP